ncbi:MAG: hypothetical protein ABRQ23_00840 [Syntrophomonadaceae bacterium]
MKINEKELEIEILMNYYSIRFNEIMYHQSRYDQAIKYLYTFGAGIFVLASFMFTSSFTPSGLPLFAAFVLLGIGAFYVSYTVLHSQFVIFALDKLLRTIESAINKRLNNDILTWETKSLPKLLDGKNTRIGCWLNPKIYEGVFYWITLVCIFLALGILYTTCSEVKILIYLYWILLGLLYFTLIIQEWLFAAKGIGPAFIEARMDEIPGPLKVD